MNNHVGVGKSGLVLAVVLGGFHLCWSALVAAGLAQPVMDFAFWMHFIKPVLIVEPFVLVKAAILFIVTAGIGFIIGAAFALLWNALRKV